MAYPINPPAIVEVAFHCTGSGQTLLTGLHWMLPAGSTSSSDGAQVLDDIWNQIKSGAPQDILSPYFACLPIGTVVDFLRLQWIWPQRYQAIQHAIGQPGGAVTASINPSAAAVITRSGDLARKGRRSNLHMPALPTSFYTDGSLTAAAITTYQNFAIATMQTLTTPGGRSFQPIVYHRADPAQSIVITTVIPMSTVRTMRRRVVGRGI